MKKFNQFIFENNDISNDPEQVIQYIKTNCSSFLSVVGTQNLYRGFAESTMPKEDVIVLSPRTDRKPKDTALIIHNAIEKLLREEGFKATRSNSFFTTSNKIDAMEYGEIFVCFPLNGFSFTWSPVLGDLYNSFYQEVHTENWLDVFPYFSEAISFFEYERAWMFISLYKLYDSLIRIYTQTKDVNQFVVQSKDFLTRYYGSNLAKGLFLDKYGLYTFLKENNITDMSPFFEVYNERVFEQRFQYTDEDMKSALKSKHEIMISTPCLFIKEDYYKSNIEEKLF